MDGGHITPPGSDAEAAVGVGAVASSSALGATEKSADGTSRNHAVGAWSVCRPRVCVVPGERVQQLVAVRQLLDLHRKRRLEQRARGRHVDRARELRAEINSATAGGVRL
eukprot:2056423-Prymnesium_polylepis.2